MVESRSSSLLYLTSIKIIAGYVSFSDDLIQLKLLKIHAAFTELCCMIMPILVNCDDLN